MGRRKKEKEAKYFGYISTLVRSISDCQTGFIMVCVRVQGGMVEVAETGRVKNLLRRLSEHNPGVSARAPIEIPSAFLARKKLLLLSPNKEKFSCIFCAVPSKKEVKQHIFKGGLVSYQMKFFVSLSPLLFSKKIDFRTPILSPTTWGFSLIKGNHMV